MEALVPTNLWAWIDQNRASFEPPVGNKVIWDDSQFTVMVVHGPNRRRDFHDDPSDEIFYQLRGSITVEYMDRQNGRQSAVVREGEMLLVPAHTLHSPHRPADTWGLVVEIKRGAADEESLLWFCERCDELLHKVTMRALDIEHGLRDAIAEFDGNELRRRCRRCGHLHPAAAPAPDPVPQPGESDHAG